MAKHLIGRHVRQLRHTGKTGKRVLFYKGEQRLVGAARAKGEENPQQPDKCFLCADMAVLLKNATILQACFRLNKAV